MHLDGLPGQPERLSSVLSDALLASPEKVALYSPTAPEVRQRNQAIRPLQWRSAEARGTAGHAAATAAGLGDKDVLRAVLCDGPMLLAWVGGYRDEPFDRREQALLQALVPQLRGRVCLENKLAFANGTLAALDVVLDALSVPAFIARRSGHVEHANVAGLALLEQDAVQLRSELAGAIREPSPRSSYRVTPIANAHLFLIQRVGEGLDVDRRLCACAARWRLTRRQIETLRHVIEGDGNATIAAKLGCGLRTAEQHVSAVLRKSGSERRSELAAKFWKR